MKPFSQACENNKQPILDILIRVFADRKKILEIGSGTGQHAVHFATHLPHLNWQTSDLANNHPGILAWLADNPLDNLLPPIKLDVSQSPWEVTPVDGMFTANTLHIMPWSAGQALFTEIPHVLKPGGKVAIYGPFNYNGQYTSDSNARFDQWLKQQAPHQGIRDFEAVNTLAEQAGLQLLEDNPMPANNRLVVWERA